MIPAAGYATRLGRPEVSKEVIPVHGRPVMTFLVDRMRAADVDAIRVVTRAEKQDVVDLARRLEADVVFGQPVDVAASLRLGVDGLADADEVVFGFPDTVWEPVDGLRRLLPPLRAGAEVALGCFVGEEPERSDVVHLDGTGRVTGIVVKPPNPSTDRIWGCAATRVRTVRALTPGEEPGVAFDRMAAAGTVVGVLLSDQFIDIGTPAALRRVGAAVAGGATAPEAPVRAAPH